MPIIPRAPRLANLVLNLSKRISADLEGGAADLEGGAFLAGGPLSGL